MDIKESFKYIRADALKHAQEVSRATVAGAQQKALKQLDDWFGSNDSVSSLQTDWSALIRACSKRASSECHSKLRSLVSAPLGGIQIDESLRASVTEIDKLLSPAVERVRTVLGENEPMLATLPFQIEQECLKVNKSVWDWLAFRSLAAVRRKLFGKPETLEREVPALVKRKRLGEEGKQALRDRLVSELSRQFPSAALSLSESLLNEYVEALGTELRDDLQADMDKHAARKDVLTQEIMDNLVIRRTLDALSDEAAGMVAEIDQLRRKYNTSSRVTGAPLEMTANDWAAVTDPDDGGIADLALVGETSDNVLDDNGFWGFCEAKDEENPEPEVKP